MANNKIILFLLFFTVACNSVQSSSTSIPEPSQIVNLYPQPTQTLLNPELASNPTATITPAQVTTLCGDIKDRSSSDFRVSGTLAFAADYSSVTNNAYLLNLATEEKILLPATQQETPGNFAMSPDHNKLAYIAEGKFRNNSRLLVVDQTGKILFEKPVSTLDWPGNVGWLDNEKILINKKQNNSATTLVTPLPVIVLNINTSLVDEYSPDYPNIYKSDPLLSWEKYELNQTVYDPTMNFVIYPDKDGNLIYWDRQQKHEITRLISANGFGYGPRWSPDGTKFISDVYVGKIIPPKQAWFEPEKLWQEELFIVNKEGIATQVTNLTRKYSEVDLGPYSWSPDGKNIAFWVRVKPDQFPDLPSGAHWVRRLAVLNIQTQDITFYCIEGDINGQNKNGSKYSRISQPPIWSPEGDKLLIDARNDNKGNIVLIADLSTNKAMKITDEMIPVGWFATAP